MDLMILHNRTNGLMQQLGQSLQSAAYFEANGKENEHKQAIEQTQEILNDIDIVKRQMGRLS